MENSNQKINSKIENKIWFKTVNLERKKIYGILEKP